MKKNKNGFTLIELLAIIALLGVVVTIATVSVDALLNKAENDTSIIQDQIVLDAGNGYAVDNINECKNGCTILIDKLEDYIENFETIKDKYICVKITKKNQKTKTKIGKDNKDCGIQYKDNSGANAPKLADGMIPVIYNDENDIWEVADTTTAWYDYSTQMWANAVTVSDVSYRTADAGTPIPMDSINSMWVWIPRYKYKIPSHIGSSENITEPPQIDVVFETGTDATGVSETVYRNGITSDGTNTNYYTHPAFRNIDNIEYDPTTTSRGAWDEEITGFWVGKFETSIDENVTTDNSSTCYSSKSIENCNTSNLTPIIKPDVESLIYQVVSNQFLTSLKFTNGTMNTSTGEVTFSVNANNVYGLNTKANTTDTHMMKNTEWGAVAILSQSQYGKMGNSSYTGINKEIYKNNSYNSTNYKIYTGRSSGVPPASGYTTYGIYSYNDKTCTTTDPICTGVEVQYAGTGASTTGTIYGVYDMSGGSYEYTMGNWAGTTMSSGFTTYPYSKYYDLYNGTSPESITKEKAILGDATYETMKWYSDNDGFVHADYPWVSRGNYYYGSSYAGVLGFNYFNGSAYRYTSFRSTLIP